MKTIKKILLYTFTLLHLPFTLIRVVIATTLILDLWCDKTIKNWMDEVGKELEDEKQFFNFLYMLLCGEANCKNYDDKKTERT